MEQVASQGDGQPKLTPNKKTHLNWTNWTIGGRIGRGRDELDEGGDDVGQIGPGGLPPPHRIPPYLWELRVVYKK